MSAQLTHVRNAFGEALEELGGKHDVYVLDAGLATSTRTDNFRNRFPERYSNVGISEQHMAGKAAGIAYLGKTVVIASFAIFMGRAWEQIRNSIAYANLDVKIIGTHAGIITGNDGVSAQATEDLAIMRAIPNMSVIVPADSVQTKAAVLKLAEIKGPVYVRLWREKTPVVYSEERFEFGKADVLRQGKDVTIIAIGPLVSIALEAAAELERQGINARVLNMATIKPLDEEAVLAAARETKAIITAEDHNIIGGLGEAVAAVTAEKHPTKVVRIGINDQFCESGKPAELYQKYGLTAENIVKKAMEALQ